jgi:hypothetical protein
MFLPDATAPAGPAIGTELPRPNAPAGSDRGTFYIVPVKKNYNLCKISKLNMRPGFLRTSPAAFMLAFVSLFGES